MSSHPLAHESKVIQFSGKAAERGEDEGNHPHCNKRQPRKGTTVNCVSAHQGSNCQQGISPQGNYHQPRKGTNVNGRFCRPRKGSNVVQQGSI